MWTGVFVTDSYSLPPPKPVSVLLYEASAFHPAEVFVFTLYSIRMPSPGE